MAVAMFLWLAWLIVAVRVEYLHAQDLPYKGQDHSRHRRLSEWRRRRRRGPSSRAASRKVYSR